MYGCVIRQKQTILYVIGKSIVDLVHSRHSHIKREKVCVRERERERERERQRKKERERVFKSHVLVGHTPEKKKSLDFTNCIDIL